MVDVLNDKQIKDGLSDLPEWRYEDRALRRTVTALDFPTALRIVDKVAVEVEKLHHHPDILIRYRTVDFTLSTHSAGGVTGLDLDLAHRIEWAAGRYLRGHD